MSRIATFGILAAAFAASALVASTAFAQDRSPGVARTPATFDGQVVTRAYVRDFADLLGLDYIGHEYCRGAACATSDSLLANLAPQAAGAALLSVQVLGNAGDVQTVILSETRCNPVRATGLRSTRDGQATGRTTGVRSIRSGVGAADCLGGYLVLARTSFAPS